VTHSSRPVTDPSKMIFLAVLAIYLAFKWLKYYKVPILLICFGRKSF
jgi:hypothetical protein